MKRVSFRGLDTELRRATYFGLLLMAGIFMLGVSVLLHSHKQKESARMREDFSHQIGTQQGFIAQEVYVNAGEALKIRLDTVLAIWKQKYPDVQACIKLEFDPASQKSPISRCSLSEQMDWTLPHGESLINAGNDPIARIHYAIAPEVGWRDIFPPSLIAALVFAFLSASILHRILMRRLHRSVLQPLVDSMAQNERNAAIAETTQMIAHDVRKPFHKLKLALQSMQLANDKESFQKIVEKLLPGIEAGAKSVEAMLKELIESGTSSLAKELISPTKLIEAALQEVFEDNETSEISLRYSLNHTRQIRAERERVLRVLLNILENALHATEGKGTFSITTQDAIDSGKPVVTFTVCNSGPAIPPSDLDNIFESFFTRKKRGHGLGLAIADRIISAHGGRIWCSSSERLGTEFHFTLPATEFSDDYSAELPSFSRDFAHSNEQTLQIGHSTPAILVFDDDPLVRDCWEKQAKQQNVEIHQFKSWEDFVSQNGFDLIANGTAFVDLQFNNSRYDGYHIASQLRKLGIRNLYAITGRQHEEVQANFFDRVLGKEVPVNIKMLVA